MKKLLIKILPTSLKRWSINRLLNMLTPYWDKVSQSIPKYELNEIHIANTSFVLNRRELIKLLPKGGVIAELGVNEGVFSAEILECCNPTKLHLVDAWSSTRYNQAKRQRVEKKFESDSQVEINIGLSTEVVNNFPNSYFDWIYIDTDHSYEVTINELECYKDKIKVGGIIAGHDYIIGNWNGMVRYGVIEAVYEYCVKYNWEILYLTAENKENPSFAIRKI